MFKDKSLSAIRSWVAVIIWMILIFALSAQPATQSSGLSKKVTKIAVENVNQWIPPDIERSTTTDLVSKYNYIVRKSAHFFAYLVLAVFVINAMKKSSAIGFREIVLALFICVIYAVSDEIHQLFVPGRGGRVVDVLIDSAGAVVGIGIYVFINGIVNKLRIRNKNHV